MLEFEVLEGFRRKEEKKRKKNICRRDIGQIKLV